MPSTTLPPPDAAAEDAWVAAWAEAEDADAIGELVSAALGARRPRLAARLVGLIEEEDGLDPAVLRRARAAARLVLVAPEPHAVEALERSWEAARSRWMQRAHSRMRGDTRARRTPAVGVADAVLPRRKPRRR